MEQCDEGHSQVSSSARACFLLATKICSNIFFNYFLDQRRVRLYPDHFSLTGKIHVVVIDLGLVVFVMADVESV